MKTTYVMRVLAVLGEPPRRYQAGSAWHELEHELGVSLPADYKEIVDGYAPVQINGHLNLLHPATDRWNLIEDIRRTSEAWSQIDWDDVEPEGDPRVALEVPELLFGVADGLIPIASTDRGESIFYAPRGRSGLGVLFVENGEGEFFEYPMGFAEWLWRWLAGEEVTGPGGSAFYPGPVALRELPMAPGERPETRYGPARDV
ncbi:SMI1/KNR4 family protein [Streptomyces sp. NPDC006134]|uniref:SMI1/KNR4 family protein n=1 Tax=Streptomyces sp. NPDC006134 TaxID=3154467 RepID=UPI0033C49F7A